jgi:hypothetical protein
MHPVLARYLNVDATVDLLRRAHAKQPIGDEHRHLLEAVRAHPDVASAATGEPGKHPSIEAQHVALFLGTHAALRALREDPAMAPHLDLAEQELKRLGADDADVESLLAQLVTDEAFATEEDVDAFDQEGFLESVGDLMVLAALDEAQVSRVLARFGAQAPQGQHLLWEQVARTLLEVAWDEGPAPITSENVQDALEAVYQELGEQQLAATATALQAFIGVMAAERWVGPLRAERLKHAAAMPLEPADEDENEDEDADDDDDEVADEDPGAEH